MDFLNTAIGSSGGVKNGICLLKVWLHQRGLDEVSNTTNELIIICWELHGNIKACGATELCNGIADDGRIY